MIAVYWCYKGYVGDRFLADVQEGLRLHYAPTSRSTNFRLFSWLSQRGFGQGYFNNSGVYQAYQKFTFKTEAERDEALKLLTASYNKYTVEIFNDVDAFRAAIAATKEIQKQMRKQNPY